MQTSRRNVMVFSTQAFCDFMARPNCTRAVPFTTPFFNLLLPREQTHVGADTGIGVLIKIERAADVRGKPLP